MKNIFKILDDREALHEQNKQRQKLDCVQTLADLKPGVLEAYRHEVLRREVRRIKSLLAYELEVEKIRKDQA